METKETPVTDATDTYRIQAAELTVTARAHLARGEWEPAVEAYKAVIGLMEGGR